MEEEKKSIINFDKLPDEEKLKVFTMYRDFMLDGMYSNCNEDTLRAKTSINVLNDLFGLQSFTSVINGLIQSKMF